jgi:putative SOS response-associated peptidase YedK
MLSVRSFANTPSLRDNSVPPRLQSAFTPEQFKTLTEKMPNWENDLADLNKDTIAAELKDLGFPAPRGAMANAILSSLYKSAIDLLAESEVPHDASLWQLSNPKFEDRIPDPINLKALRGSFLAAEEQVVKVLPDAKDSKGPLLVGLQAGMGIGKSYAIDIADQLLFVNEKPIVLKVSYNYRQNLAFESNPENAGKGLLARVILAFHKKVPPDSRTIIEKAVRHDVSDLQLTEQNVAAWIRSQPGVENLPIILAVDEIASLKNLLAMQAVLSAVAGLMKEFWALSSGQQKSVGLITALPSTDLTSLSQRQPVMITPQAFSNDESDEFLQQCCPDATPLQREEMALVCGGHPRSLAVAAIEFNETSPHVVPTPNQVAKKCYWKIGQGFKAKVVAAAIAEAYRFGDDECSFDVDTNANMQKLHDRAMLMKRNGSYAIAPTVLWSDEEDKFTLFHIRSMFAWDTKDSPTKGLERINLHWDFFKCINKLPVIAPVMAGRKNTPPDEAQKLMFCFDPTRAVNEEPILKQNGGLEDGIKALKIDNNSYYFPKRPNHRALESMCVAETSTGRKVLCLFQSKINAELMNAVEGLNTAARELQEVWPGDFLFVIFALKSDPAALTTSDHPILLVTEELLPKYFTSTLAPAAQLAMKRHQRSLKESK